MMPSFVGASLPCIPPVSYSNDALFEALSKQMSTPASRRQSRGSNGALGNAMRVVKPTSASNSPRNNLMQQRRRTMMNDLVLQQRAQQMLDQPYLPTPGPEVFANNYYEPVKRTARPVSWHPSTQLPQTYQLSSLPAQQQQQQQQQQQSLQFPFPNYCDYDFSAPPVQMPPTPAAYSAYSSPISNFSPLVLPSYAPYEMPQTQAYASPAWDPAAAAPAAASMPSTGHTQTPAFIPATVYTPASVPGYVEPSYSPASWMDIPSTGYSVNLTTPPTPEDMPNIQLPEPVVMKQASAVYPKPEVKDDDYDQQQQDVENDGEDGEEEEGDILIGLGLYDPPEKLGLLGASFEPTGKGLRLEDAWEPPATDDEEEDEEEDGEGEADSDDE